MNCVRFPFRTTSRTVCSKDQLFLQTEGTIDPVALLQKTGVEAAQKRPLTMRIAFRKEAVAEFAKMIDADDWSRFPTARGFYFLSCIRDIRGAIAAASKPSPSKSSKGNCRILFGNEHWTMHVPGVRYFGNGDSSG